MPRQPAKREIKTTVHWRYPELDYSDEAPANQVVFQIVSYNDGPAAFEKRQFFWNNESEFKPGKLKGLSLKDMQFVSEILPVLMNNMKVVNSAATSSEESE